MACCIGTQPSFPLTLKTHHSNQVLSIFWAVGSITSDIEQEFQLVNNFWLFDNKNCKEKMKSRGP